MNNSNDIALLERQRNIAYYMLLATVLTTVADLVLLLTSASIMIPYCAALPYYLTMLGNYFDGYTFSTYTITGLIMAAVLLAGWLLVWWMAKKKVSWLKAGLILVILDTVFLAIFALVFLEEPAKCLLEGLMHLAVIYEIYVGLKAHQRLEQIQQAATTVPEPLDFWGEETPAESEYSDTIE